MVGILVTPFRGSRGLEDYFFRFTTTIFEIGFKLVFNVSGGMDALAILAGEEILLGKISRQKRNFEHVAVFSPLGKDQNIELTVGEDEVSVLTDVVLTQITFFNLKVDEKFGVITGLNISLHQNAGKKLSS